jgi:hypothetical protein
MENNRHQRKWTFGLSWVIVNTFGWGLSILVALAAGLFVWQVYQSLSTPQMRFLSDELNRMLLSAVILGVSWGAIIGLLQELVLKQRFDLENGTWMGVTLVGIAIYTILPALLSILTQDIGSSFLYLTSFLGRLAGSTAFGIAQWLFLRKYFTRSGWWIFATVVASVIAYLTSLILFRGGGRSYLFFAIVSLAFEGLVYGFITLIALTLISRQSSKVA